MSQDGARWFGRFEIRGDLGGGGQGVVYRAWDPERGREVALKVLHASAGTVARDRLRLAREATLFADQAGAHVVTPIDTGVRDNATWVTYELVEGLTLKDVLARLRAAGHSPDRIDRDTLAAIVPPAGGGGDDGLVRFACRVAMETALALGSLHARGVAHGDVKPSNVMLDATGTVRLIDLGLAERRTGDDREAMLGDVTRLGHLLFELLTFVDPTRLARTRGVGAGGVPPARPRRHHRGLDRAVDAICAAAIASDAALRYFDVKDVAADLGAVLTGAPVAVHVPARLERVAAAVRAHGAWLAVSFGVLAVLAGGGIWARVAASRALAAERLAEERSLAILGLSDELWMDELEARATALFPPVPERLEGYDAWLADADELLRRLAAHRAERDRIASRVAPHPAGGDDVTRFRLARLRAMLEREPALAALAEDVHARRVFAATLRARSIDDHRETWLRVRADVLADPRFGGLYLSPQLGLVPLARNRITGLWEFLALGTGAAPREIDDAVGTYHATEETGIILVLVPGGEATPEGAGAPVAVAPFFIARHEMTQAQWIARRANPSWNVMDGPGARSLPVESVSFDECEQVLFEVGLAVPSTTEWEWAARGGSATAWYPGDDPRDLEGHANLADATIRRAVGEQRIKAVPWDDGHLLTAPVASFAANPFGLFDVMGNVSEWTSDPEPPPASEGVDVVSGASRDFRSILGGCYTSDVDAVRPDARLSMRKNERLPSLGVRPFRRVDP